MGICQSNTQPETSTPTSIMDSNLNTARPSSSSASASALVSNEETKSKSKANNNSSSSSEQKHVGPRGEDYVSKQIAKLKDVDVQLNAYDVYVPLEAYNRAHDKRRANAKSNDDDGKGPVDFGDVPRLIDVLQDLIGFEWNEVWQSLYETVASTPQSIKELRERQQKVLKNFVYFCTTVASVLVKERDLPYGEKQVKPSDIGGVAGGEKFEFGSVLFKFASGNFSLFLFFYLFYFSVIFIFIMFD